MAVGGGGGAGGSSPGDIRAGGAYYEIAGRETVIRTADRIQSRMEKLKGVFSKMNASGVIGGLVGGAIGGPIGTIFAGGAIEVGKKAAEYFMKSVYGVQKLNAELKKTDELITNYEKSLSRASKLAASWRAGVTDPGVKLASVHSERSRIEKDLLSFYEKAYMARDAYNRLPTGTPEEGKKSALENAMKLEAQVTSLKDKLYDLNIEGMSLRFPEQSAAVIGALGAEINKTRSEIMALSLGYDEVDRALEPFARMGASVAQLKELRQELTALADVKHNLKNLPNAASPIFGGILGAATMASAKVGELLKKFEGAKGISGGTGAMQRLGYGDVAMKRQEALLQKIADHTTPSKLAREISKAMEMQ